VSAAYLPASNFAILDPAYGQLMFDVTAVPEPSTLALTFGGSIALVLFGRRRRIPRKGV